MIGINLKRKTFLLCYFIILLMIFSCSSSGDSGNPSNPDLHFSVTGLLPQSPRIGYSMVINGLGFGTNPTNVSIAFFNQTQVLLPAEVLNLTNTSITLVVPFGAVSGNISITVNGETLLYPVTLANIVYKPVYFFENGNMKYFSYNTENKIAITTMSNPGLGLSIDEIYSLEYNATGDFFYGFTHYSLGSNNSVRMVKFTNNNNQFTTYTICSNYPSSGCPDILESVTNTSNNKNYCFSDGALTISEINNSGTLTTMASFPDISLTSKVVFIPQINSFVYIDDQVYTIVIHKINATTFSHTSSTLTGTFSNNLNGLYYPKPFYKVSDNKLYLARPDDIYNIDFSNNTIQSLNTDWFVFTENTNDTPSSSPRNFIYYEPTNDFILAADSFSTDQRLYAVNLATKKTRIVPMHNIYGSGGRIFEWVVKN